MNLCSEMLEFFLYLDSDLIFGIHILDPRRTTTTDLVKINIFNK